MNLQQKQILIQAAIDKIKSLDMSFLVGLTETELRQNKSDEILAQRIEHIRDSIDRKINIVQDVKKILEGVI